MPDPTHETNARPAGLFDRLLSRFERLTEPFPEARPERPPDSLLPFLWHYAKPYWPFLALIAVLSVAIALLEVTLFGFVGNVVDWLATADRETFLETEGTTLLVMGAVMLVGLPLVHILYSLVFYQSLMGNFPMSIRWQAHRFMLGQSMRFYQDEYAGRVATKVMQTALGVRESVLKVIDMVVYVAFYFLGSLLLVASFEPMLMVPFIVWLVIYGLTLYHFLPRMRDIAKQQADARSLMTGRVVDSYTNIATVKLFAHAGRETAYARESMDGFLQTVHRQMRLSTGLNAIVDMLNNLLLFAVGFVALAQWLNGSSTVAAVAVAAAITTRLSGMSHWVMWELSGLFENIGMTIDGMNSLSKPRDAQDRPGAPALAVTKGAVEYQDVTFAYDQQGAVIRSMNLSIAPGEKIGLIGRSGAGKTTMINVLLRLYDVSGGKVLIDGQDIAKVTQESLRANIAVVTQDTSLLHRSVRENIAYGRPDASDAQIKAAAHKANAHEFIGDLKDNLGNTGYDAQVGERGVKLSGGQRQRIAIARIFLKDAPILVLDEATSALDSEVEAVIQEQLFALMEGKTVLAIAHRLSTIADMDRLVVLDEGRIVEQGTHNALKQAGGLYQSLWARQSGGFLVEPPAAS